MRLKWSLIHFKIVREMNFDPLLIFEAIIVSEIRGDWNLYLDILNELNSGLRLDFSIKIEL